MQLVIERQNIKDAVPLLASELEFVHVAQVHSEQFW